MRLTTVTCCYFKKYVEREIAKATGVSYYKPFQGWREKRRKTWHYTANRPWTDAAKQENAPNEKPKKVLVEPIKEWKIFKGDRVEILTGKDKGKQGIVNCIIKERNWCFVEGLNCTFELKNNSPTNPGVMTKEEQPLLVTTEVSLVDPSDNKPTAVQWRYTEKGEKVRISKTSGRIIPLTDQAAELDDFVVPNIYQENKEKDTLEKALKKITFSAVAKSFEEDIMDKMGIKDDRKRVTGYFY